MGDIKIGKRRTSQEVRELKLYVSNSFHQYKGRTSQEVRELK